MKAGRFLLGGVIGLGLGYALVLLFSPGIRRKEGASPPPTQIDEPRKRGRRDEAARVA